MHFVYILESNINGSYYVGSCDNVEARHKQHNDGLVKSTRRYSPWELIHSEQYNTLSEARKRELQIKRWKKRSAIEKLVKSKIK